MTKDVLGEDPATIYGLGANEEPADPRDYPIDALYAAEELEPTDAATLPGVYKRGGMPAVLDQGNTGRCVAFSSSTMKSWQDKRDQDQWFNFDEAKFFFSIGGTDTGGANTRDAMAKMLADGYPVYQTGDAANHKIAAYYSVPVSKDAIKQAIYDFGPVVVSTAWYHSWFRPRSDGTLPAGDYIVGGHAIVAYGWDDAKGLLLRNSWGSDWGPLNGDCYMPWADVAKLRLVWKTQDAIEHPIPYLHTFRALGSVRLRSKPSTAGSALATVAKGAVVKSTQLEKYGGSYIGLAGRTRTDWLKVSYAGRTGWVARGYMWKTG